LSIRGREAYGSGTVLDPDRLLVRSAAARALSAARPWGRAPVAS